MPSASMSTSGLPDAISWRIIALPMILVVNPTQDKTSIETQFRHRRVVLADGSDLYRPG